MRQIISSLSPEKEAQIPFYIEKWRAFATATHPINPEKTREGLAMVCREIGAVEPKIVRVYPSPDALFRDFENWKGLVSTVMHQYWEYQIPLCDPGSMHRYWSPGSQRAAFNFSAKRYSPGTRFALCESQDSDEERGRVLARKLHGEIWDRFKFDVPLDWHLASINLFFRFEEMVDLVEDRLYHEDNTFQGHPTDCVNLGPEPWLLRELACVDFCRQVLKVPRNENLYRGLEMLIENGGYIATFGELLLLSERPTRIEWLENETARWCRLHFADGEVFDPADAV